jgi:ribonuclease HI
MGITEWIRGWKAKGWRTSDQAAVKNVELAAATRQLVAEGGTRSNGAGSRATPAIRATSAPDALANKVDQGVGRI